MSLAKKNVKNKPVCKVTFEMDKTQVPTGKKVFVVGDFNDWDHQANQLKAKKNGALGVTLDLETGREYQFRYLIGEDQWENEPHADRQEPNRFGSHNSVLAL